MSDEGPHSNLENMENMTPGRDNEAVETAKGFIEGYDAAMRSVVLGDDRSRKWLHHQIFRTFEEKLTPLFDLVNWGEIADLVTDDLLKSVTPIPDDDPRPDQQRGMYGKYYVERLHDVLGKHDGCRYFVLDPQHDPHAAVALKRYAAACAGTHPHLSDDIMGWLKQVPFPQEQSNIRDHAMRELKIAGWLSEDMDVYSTMIVLQLQELLEIFIAGGHSGMSAGITMQMFMKLASFENLTALTNDPSEWNPLGSGGWQSSRNSEAFSSNEGRTYYLLSERRPWMYPAFSKLPWAIRRRLMGRAISIGLLYPRHKSLDAGADRA